MVQDDQVQYYPTQAFDAMRDILVVGTLKEGQFPNSWAMKSDEGIAERRKIADLSKPLER